MELDNDENKTIDFYADWCSDPAEDEINYIFDDYKLAFNPIVIDKLDESIFDRDEFAHSEIKTINFLTDDESWFNQEVINDYIDGYEMVLVVIKAKNLSQVKFINDNKSCDYDMPWYKYLESVYNKSDHILFCNKKYSCFDERIKLKKEYESRPVTTEKLDEFLKYLEYDSNN